MWGCKLRSLAVALLGAVLGFVIVPAPATAAPSPTYYVALGDSLSTGGGATAGQGYVDQVFAFAQQSIPGLVLKNLGCGGDDTTRMINGGLCHNYTTGNQLGDAEAFLAAHAGSISFVTIDVGGDDIVGCGLSGSINQTCVAKALQNIATNLPIILASLRAQAPKVTIVGMTYYDPILADWLSGPAGQATARESVTVLKELNTSLMKIYRKFHVKVANAQRAFASTNFRGKGSYNGQTLPRNVANICNWTHMCETNPNIHTNDVGHTKLAAVYEAKLRGVLFAARRELLRSLLAS
jgi:lysophospholipase L1-like esterase